jgi:polar amino acid transport system substrate-binding protein
MFKLTVTLLMAMISFYCVAEQRYVTAYAYHLKPPFIANLSTEQGLYYDLSRFLSQNSEYEFYTVFVPRKRIDKLLANNQLDGIVIGVNPKWFADVQQEKYRWTQSFFTDKDEFISLKSQPFDYTGADSLAGKTLAGVRGFVYANIEPALAQNSMRRFNTIGEEEVINMILMGRANTGIVSRSTFDYLIPRIPDMQNLHISAQPHDKFERKILVPKNNPKLYAEIELKLAQLQQNQRWLAILQGYKSKPIND